MDLALVHAAEIKGVHGLAVLQHHIVCDIHNVVDGPHARVADALAHPIRGRSNFNILYHSGRIAGAECRLLDDNFGVVVDISAGQRLNLGLVELQLLAEGDGRLSGKADGAEAVGPVGGYLEVHNMIVPAQKGGHIGAGGAVLMHDKDAVGNAVRELLLLGVQVL